MKIVRKRVIAFLVALSTMVIFCAPSQVQADKSATQLKTEIEELEEYMNSDEYIEQVAKEKLGMVKDGEIIFKEAD